MASNHHFVAAGKTSFQFTDCGSALLVPRCYRRDHDAGVYEEAQAQTPLSGGAALVFYGLASLFDCFGGELRYILLRDSDEPPTAPLESYGQRRWLYFNPSILEAYVE